MAQRIGHLATDQAIGGSSPSECTQARLAQRQSGRPTRDGPKVRVLHCALNDRGGCSSARQSARLWSASPPVRIRPSTPCVGGRVWSIALGRKPSFYGTRWFESIPAHSLPGSGSASEFPKLGCPVRLWAGRLWRMSRRRERWPAKPPEPGSTPDALLH